MKPTCIIFDKSRLFELVSDNTDGSVDRTHVFMTHVFRNRDRVFNLLAFSNLSNTDSLEFGIIDENGGNPEIFSIDNDTKNHLLSFLKQTDSKDSQNQDCMQFLKHCVGEGNSKGEFELKNYTPCNPSNIKPGGIISMNGGSSHHGTIYLGSGIFLSRFGPGGPVGGASLDQLKELYKPTEVIAWNKKDSSD